MKQEVNYPVGEQSFEKIAGGDWLYVDKTRFLKDFMKGGYFFLSRPRRFGKSLFLSMMKCFFEGKRHLFKGLFVDSLSWGWEPMPVLHLDLNIDKYKGEDSLDAVLVHNFEIWEREYGVTETPLQESLRFANIIEAAHKKTGKRVVVLVDEYDKPLVNNLNESCQFKKFRDRLSAIYSAFKSCADHLHLVFLTGVSRFGKLSVFSGLNNLRDISFSDKYSDICGISERELYDNFQTGLQTLAQQEGVSENEICRRLKSHYDGYRFSEGGVDIYNPYSLLSVMAECKFKNYWIQSGEPTLLLEQLKRFNVDLSSMFSAQCSEEDLIGLDLENPRPVALLYQTGYLTIKGFDRETDLFTLGLPNSEVKKGFLNYLLPYYANLHNDTSSFVVSEFVKEFRNGDVPGFMKRLQSLFASVSYEMRMDEERNLHNALLMLMILVGLEVQTEFRTSDGRIDLFVMTERYYYIIEIKLDSSPQEALRQIERKDYSLPFSVDGRAVIKIGVNFSSSLRRPADWQSVPEFPR